MAVSLLLLIPLLTIQGPPKVQWIDEPTLAPPPAPPPPGNIQREIRTSNISEGRIQEPWTIPATIANLNEQAVAASPDVSNLGVGGGTGTNRRGVFGGNGPSWAVAPPPPPRPVATQPLKVSHWAEGNLIYRVKPIYPAVAREARVQGAVELRAIVSKTGTIKNLGVVSGHPMLSAAAIEAVRQWRYRPYLLNNEPVEVETEITVNFMLADD